MEFNAHKMIGFYTHYLLQSRISLTRCDDYSSYCALQDLLFAQSFHIFDTLKPLKCEVQLRYLFMSTHHTPPTDPQTELSAQVVVFRLGGRVVILMEACFLSATKLVFLSKRVLAKTYFELTCRVEL
jgi:hypothetical protein